MLTVWPSGTGQLEDVCKWLDDAGARIVYSAPVELRNEAAEVLTVMALYDGEEWLESNAWYMEQPLPTGPPIGPYAGAKWKRALCYRNPQDRRPHAIVADVGAATSSLWSSKYGLRRTLAAKSGNPGNSCIHLTDEQSSRILAGRRRTGQGGGLSCDESYACTCARALLHPSSLSWLDGDATRLELGSPVFRRSWQLFTSWLQEAGEEAGGDDQEGPDCFPPAPASFLCDDARV